MYLRKAGCQPDLSVKRPGLVCTLPIIPHILGGERNERAVSLFDRTHRASFTYVYELP
jgi:hypothetical protein